MAERIRGHYVPKFYLTGFTHGGTDTSELVVVDTGRKKQWASTPYNAAKEWDMYAIDPAEPDGDRQAIEKAFGQLEGKFAEVVRQVIAGKSLPTEKTRWDWLMNFVALLSVRVPHFRDKLDEFTNTIYTKMLQMQLATADRRAALQKDIEENQDIAPHIALAVVDRLKDAAEDGRISFANRPNTYVKTMLDMVDPMLHILAARKWALWTVQEHAPDLICSDVPVALIPKSGKFSPYGVGFGIANTWVFVPINRRVVMVGSFEPIVPMTLDRVSVATVNSGIATWAKQIYYAGPDFIWMMKDGTVGNVAKLLAWFKEQSVVDRD